MRGWWGERNSHKHIALESIEGLKSTSESFYWEHHRQIALDTQTLAHLTLYGAEYHRLIALAHKMVLDVRHVEMLAIIFDDDELFIYSHTECEWRKRVCSLLFIFYSTHTNTGCTRGLPQFVVCVCECVWKWWSGGRERDRERELYLAALNKLFHIYYLIRSHLQAKRITDLGYFLESRESTRGTFKCRLCSQ